MTNEEKSDYLREFGGRVKQYRLQAGMSLDELARKCGYASENARSSIQKIEAGKADLPASKIKSLASALGVSISELTSSPTPQPQPIPKGLQPMPKMKLLPKLGSIACGAPTYAEGTREGLTETPDYIDADYTLTCKGESMIGAGIKDGDTVYIRQQSIVENGQIAAVCIDEDTTLKKVYLYPDMLVLRPCNDAFPEIVLHKEEMNSAQILGLAVGWTHLLKA